VRALQQQQRRPAACLGDMHAQTPVLTYRCATPATSGIGRLAWGWDLAGALLDSHRPPF